GLGRPPAHGAARRCNASWVDARVAPVTQKRVLERMRNASTMDADFPDLARESRDIWDQNARWWDARMGEGNDWHRSLIAPAVEKLLGVQPGERVLELACGNGQFARRLASMGARVVACDSSGAFLDCARMRTSEHSERIEYRLIDLTGEEQLAALGPGEFDAAVCNMALMDIACIRPLLRAVRHVLKAGSRFVFSVPHPASTQTGLRSWLSATT